MVYVTHDIEEALSMADEIALLNRGRVEQSGEPRALFHRPRNEFVARFMGEASIIEGTVTRHEQHWGVLLEGAENGSPLIILPDEIESTHQLSARARGRFVLRPHYLSFPSASEYRISGCIEGIAFTGPVTHVVIRCTPSQTITVAIPSCRTTLLQPGMTIEVSYQPADIAEIIENSGR
jgi:ABC-type Fe3+/spermidine/putrescine transport system ATPase subunit